MRVSEPEGFLGIGECMVELSDAGDGLLRRSFAGDVFNTLWYARRALGEICPVRFLSAVGQDALSCQMLAFIEDAGIGTDLVARISDRRPGLYMIHLDGAERSFSYWREHSAARLLASDRGHLARAIRGASVVYFSGITLAILPEDDAEAMLGELHEARDAGRMVVFDPNIRPALWPEPDRMRRMIMRAAECASIVLPGFDDEAGAFGDADAAATMARYASCGPGLVVLKDGPGNVIVQERGGDIRAFPTSPVPAPVDTTGAGDSFNGAFVADYMRSSDIATAVAAGQTCAAEVICHRGALIAGDSGSS